MEIIAIEHVADGPFLLFGMQDGDFVVLFKHFASVFATYYLSVYVCSVGGGVVEKIDCVVGGGVGFFYDEMPRADYGVLDFHAF